MPYPLSKESPVKVPSARLSLCALAAALAACSSDNNNSFNPRTAKGPDTQCVVGDLANGTTVTGDLSAATACSYPTEYDSTITGLAVSYNFGAAAGKGYLISLLSALNNQTTLIGGTSTAKTVLAYADYQAPLQATMILVPPANTGYSVRVGAYDSTRADTGAYSLRAQTCKVPLGTITDSVTHQDVLGPGDCVDPLGDWEGEDSSYIHVYQIQFDSNSARTLAFVAGDSSLAFNIGGPGFDPYGYLDNSTQVRANDITSASGTFTSKRPGIYTLIVGTTYYSPTSHSYTLTIGGQTPGASRVPTGTPFGSTSSARMHKLRQR